MKNKYIIIGSGLTLRKVNIPGIEDIVVLCTDELPECLSTSEYSEDILDSIMKGIHTISKSNLPSGAFNRLNVEPSAAEVKKFLCTPLNELFKENLIKLLVKLGAHYVYDLIPLTRADYKKVYGFGLIKIEHVENVVTKHGITTELRSRLGVLLARSTSFDHKEMVETIHSMTF